MVAVGDAAGIVSSWDVVYSCLITAAQAHEGPATSVGWMNGSNSSTANNSVVSCGYDGTLATLQIDPGIYKLYRAAFRGLYHSCKRNHKVGATSYCSCIARLAVHDNASPSHAVPFVFYLQA